MSDGGRHDERGGALEPTGDDLLDLLYGELDGEAARAARARVAADPRQSARLGGLERVRELYRDLPDEEPPARLTAQLLAQAAQAQAGRTQRRAASSRGGDGGFWRRLSAWMAPVFAHPGLAAAASAVLVVGVAGLLYLRKGTDLTRVHTAPPALDQVETPAAPAAAPVGNLAARDGFVDSSSTVGGGVGGAAADTSADTGSSSAVAAPEAEAVPPDPTDKSRPRRRTKVAADRKDRGPADGDDARGAPVLGLREGEARPAAPAATPAAESGEELEKRSESAAGQAAAPPPPPSSAPAPSTPAKEPDAAEKPQAPSSPADLHKQALAAASSSRCLEVQQLGQSVRRLDPGYYDKVFRPDRRLAVCLSAGKATKARGK